MGVNATVCIPIGPKHVELAKRAMQSVEAQTQPASMLWIVDEHGRGPGALRNEMLAQVMTPFVIFLDADDWIEPTFIERTLAKFNQTAKYVYTDWIEDDIVRFAPDKAWCGETWHCITTLLPTAWAREVGGFDPTLPAMEDSDFYKRLCTARHCGVRLAEPLFWYSNDGNRSDDLRANEVLYRSLKGEIARRYANQMGCCGSSVDDQPPVGARLDGDVVAQALWHGNGTKVGRRTGRVYARTSWPHTLWVDPQDVDAMPTMFRLAETPINEPVPMNGLDALDVAIRGATPPVVRSVATLPVKPVASKPDVAKVLRLGKRK